MRLPEAFSIISPKVSLMASGAGYASYPIVNNHQVYNALMWMGFIVRPGSFDTYEMGNLCSALEMHAAQDFAMQDDYRLANAVTGDDASYGGKIEILPDNGVFLVAKTCYPSWD
jgi:hypothetical protein